jgi:hypothetical protein
MGFQVTRDRIGPALEMIVSFCFQNSRVPPSKRRNGDTDDDVYIILFTSLRAFVGRLRIFHHLLHIRPSDNDFAPILPERNLTALLLSIAVGGPVAGLGINIPTLSGSFWDHNQTKGWGRCRTTILRLLWEYDSRTGQFVFLHCFLLC